MHNPLCIVGLIMYCHATNIGRMDSSARTHPGVTPAQSFSCPGHTPGRKPPLHAHTMPSGTPGGFLQPTPQGGHLDTISRTVPQSMRISVILWQNQVEASQTAPSRFEKERAATFSESLRISLSSTCLTCSKSAHQFCVCISTTYHPTCHTAPHNASHWPASQIAAATPKLTSPPSSCFAAAITCGPLRSVRAAPCCSSPPPA